MNEHTVGIPFLSRTDGDLSADGHPLNVLAQRTRTPALVYSEKQIRRNHERFVSSFQPPDDRDLRIAYSVKTAWEPGLIRLISSLGIGAEVSCSHELELCKRAGFSSAHIHLDGVVHSLETLSHGIQTGVRYVKVDSLQQVRLLAEIGESQGQIGIGLRLKSPNNRWLRGPAEGLAGRFGLSSKDFETALSVIDESPSLTLKCIAVHIGSQITGPRSFTHAVKYVVNACHSAVARGLKPDEVNLGGGFPSPTLGSPSVIGFLQSWIRGHSGTIPEISRFGNAISSVFKRYPLPQCVRSLSIEPGRSLVSGAAVLLTRIVDIRGRWIFVDTSRNHVPEALVFGTRRFLPVHLHDDPVRRRYHISGRSMSGGDVLALGVKLPPCREGDLLAMLDAGAYTLSKANRFTMLIPPAYLLTKKGDLQTVRRRETWEDAVKYAESW